MIKEEDAQVRLKVEFKDRNGKWKRSNTWYYFKTGEAIAALLRAFIPFPIDSSVGGGNDKT